MSVWLILKTVIQKSFDIWQVPKATLVQGRNLELAELSQNSVATTATVRRRFNPRRTIFATESLATARAQ